MDPIPHNRPLLGRAEEAAVIAVLRSAQIGGGATRTATEEALSQAFGGGAAALVSSGTAALYLALRALGLPPGSRVAVPTYSCVALLEASSLAGLECMPVDSCDYDLTMDVADLDRLPATRWPAAAIAVHQYGARADVASLAARVPDVIEDASQSFGTRFGDRLSHPASRAVAVSFYATKVMTCGQGGAVWSPDGSLVDRVRMHAGVNNGRVGGNDFNFQMSDVAAAILRAQLPRLDEVRRARRELAARFAAACPRQLETLWNGHDAGRLWYRFIVLADSEQERERLIAHFRAAHICADGLLRKPQLLHRILGLDPAAFPRAERWAERIVSIPLHPSLTSTEVRRIEDALSDYRP